MTLATCDGYQNWIWETSLWDANVECDNLISHKEMRKCWERNIFDAYPVPKLVDCEKRQRLDQLQWFPSWAIRDERRRGWGNGFPIIDTNDIITQSRHTTQTTGAVMTLGMNSSLDCLNLLFYFSSNRSSRSHNLWLCLLVDHLSWSFRLRITIKLSFKFSLKLKAYLIRLAEPTRPGVQ